LTVPVKEGPFTAELAIPETAHGSCYIRAFVEGSAHHALGAAELSIVCQE
jgi:hypothetical protein